MRQKLQKGAFFTFEGGEGAGKTTLIESLNKELKDKGYDVLTVREPGGTKVGEHIRNILLQREDIPISARAELALFLAARAQHVEEIILPALQAKKIVLCDRFNDSTVVYQGYARGLEVKKVKNFCLYISHNLEPNLTFYLDIDPKIGLLRIQTMPKDRIEAEKLSFHEKIREAYLLIAQQNPKRVQVIDANEPLEKILKITLDSIANYFTSLENV